MSASREKKKRQNQPEFISAQTTNKTSGKGLKRLLTVVIAIVLVAAIVFLGMVSTGFFQKYTTAAVAAGHNLTPAMLNYYYVSAYNSMSSYIGTLIDADIPLDEQQYPEEGYDTWADYIADMAVHNAANTYAVYDEATANGFVLSEEANSHIDSEIEMLDMYSSVYGYSNGNSLLTAQYGTGCNKDNYREYLTVSNTAAEYSTQIQEGFTYTQEELDAYYTENSDSFDSVSYRVFSVNPSVLGLEDSEDTNQLCEDAAMTITEAAKQGEQAFMDAVVAALPEDSAADYDAATATLRENVTYVSLPDSYRDWMIDEARQAGDVTCVESEDGKYFVLYFLNFEDLSFQLPNVRHILISASDPADETAMASAKEEAESILKTYQDGEQTEDAFAALAKEHSADNAEAGGLYENIAPNTMVETFDAWCFDAARQPGDTGIVETQYGYHVMYFVGYGSSYQDYLVENDMLSKDFNEWSEGVTGDITHTLNESALRFLKDI